jgi:hypothetical protein
VQVRAAREAAGLDAARARTAASRLCGSAMLERIATATAKAAAAIDKRCGATGSASFTAEQSSAHIDLVGCIADETVAAAYGDASGALAEITVDGRPVSDRFPCIARQR